MHTEARRIVVGDGTTVAYTVVDGDEPAVVILHGLAGSSREFLATTQALGRRKVILVDQRGHGASTTVPIDTSRAAFVSDAVQVVSAESSAPVDLVGQSMGAHTAMLTAASRPDLVRRLVLLEGNEGGGTAEDHAAVGNFFRSWDVPFADRTTAAAALGDGPLERAWVDDLEERAGGLYPRFDANVMQATIEAVGVPRWAEWESVEVPTLVVYADSGIFSEEQKTEFVRRGRNVHRVDLHDASHDAHLDAFDQWADALVGFISAS